MFWLFRYKVVLDSDSWCFDGHGRVNHDQGFTAEDYKWDGRPYSFRVYSPARTALVLALVDETQ